MLNSPSVTPVTPSKPTGGPTKRKKTSVTGPIVAPDAPPYPDDAAEVSAHGNPNHPYKKHRTDLDYEATRASVSPATPPEGQAIVYTNARMLVDSKGNFGTWRPNVMTRLGLSHDCSRPVNVGGSYYITPLTYSGSLRRRLSQSLLPADPADDGRKCGAEVGFH